MLPTILNDANPLFYWVCAIFEKKIKKYLKKLKKKLAI